MDSNLTDEERESVVAERFGGTENRTTVDGGSALRIGHPVIGRMARGEGTLGRLSQDETLYTSLTNAIVSLDSLLVDVKANPGRYVKIEIF